MKVKTNPAPLFDHATTSFYKAAEQVRDIAIANAASSKSHGQPPGPRAEYPQSPPLARNTKMWRRNRKDRPTATVGNRKSRHASVMERGGGPAGPGGWHRRGPHVQRNRAPRPVGRAIEQFGSVYTAQLRRAPIMSAAYMEHGAREIGPSFGVMVGTPR